MDECILNGEKWHRYIIIDLKIVDNDGFIDYTMSAYTQEDMKTEKKIPSCTSFERDVAKEMTHEKEDEILLRLFGLIRNRIKKLKP